MYVYRGKLDLLSNAVNEAITIIFSTDFDIGQPVSAFWQWTKDGQGNANTHKITHGTIDSVTPSERKIGFLYDQYYRFDGTHEAGFKSLTLTMRNIQFGETSSGFTLQLSYSEPPFMCRCLVYTGMLEFSRFARSEMIIVVVPSPSFSNKQNACIFWQWTEDHTGQRKANQDWVRPMSTSKQRTGAMTLHVETAWYRFDGEVSRDRDVLTLTMSDPGPDGCKSNTITLRLAKTLTDRKKALIARYDVGIDGDIHAVRDMLVDTLGFSPVNVEMLYYDTEYPGGACGVFHGQEAPTAKRFRERFVALLQDTKPGDVRFVYVDVHGVPLESRDVPGERGPDKAWKFAEGEDGRRSELVGDEWIADAVKNHLSPNANFTILCSSCLGGGLLDAHRNPPGVLLSAVHETQINIKAVKDDNPDVKDPWTNAILNVIRKNKNRRMLTYDQLCDRARLYIHSMLDSGRLSEPYKGPSPDPAGKPIAWTEGAMEGHQDPQLVFNGWYIDAAKARFLESLLADPPSPKIDDGPARYPHDKL